MERVLTIESCSLSDDRDIGSTTFYAWVVKAVDEKGNSCIGEMSTFDDRSDFTGRRVTEKWGEARMGEFGKRRIFTLLPK